MDVVPPNQEGQIQSGTPTCGYPSNHGRLLLSGLGWHFKFNMKFVWELNTPEMQWDTEFHVLGRKTRGDTSPHKSIEKFPGYSWGLWANTRHQAGVDKLCERIDCFSQVHFRIQVRT